MGRPLHGGAVRKLVYPENTEMIRSFAKLIGIVVVLVLGAVTAPLAQETAFEQLKLTEAQLKGYLAAQGELNKLLEKVEEAGDKPNPELVKSLDALATKHGFKSFDELDQVAANISFVFTGFDQDSEGFIEPKKAMQQEIEALKNDKTIPDKERKALIEELADAINVTPEVKHKENIALVRKYLKPLAKALN